LQNIRASGRIILKCILKKEYGRGLWIVLVWLRKRNGGELL